MPAGASFTEVDASFSPSVRAAAAYGMPGKTERGPLRTPTLITTWDEFKRIYGGLLLSDPFPLYCKRALEAGARLYVSRLVHYSSISDPSTTSASQASYSINDRQTAATNPFLLTSAGPWDFSALIGGSLVIDKDQDHAGSTRTITPTATRAAVESVAVGSLNFTGGKTLTLKIGRKNTTSATTVQSITISAGDFADATAPTPAEMAASINKSLLRGKARVTNTTKVTIEADPLGTESFVQVTNTGNANALLGFSTSEVLGTGDFKDASDVQPAELKSVIDAASDAALTVTLENSNTRVKILLNTLTGTGHYIGINATSTLAAPLGFTEGSGGDQTGLANQTDATLKVLGKYHGTYAAGWTVQISDRSLDGSSEFTLTVPVQTGIDVAEVWGNLSMDSTSPRYALSLINDPEKGSKWIALEDLTSNGSTAALKRPATGTYTLAGGNDGLSSFGETDIVGDASAQTGIYAFDGISGLDCQDLVIPYLVTNPTAQSLISYCETRRDMMVHFFRQLSSGADVSSIRDYRQSAGAFTGGTNFDSSYGALYAASTRYLDPLTNVKSFRLPVGDLVAALNFNDTGSGRLPDGDYGVFLAPAGEKRGRLSVDDVEFDVAQGARTHLVTLGDQNHINAIHRFNGKVIIGDAWTLRRDSTLLQWTNVRRMMIFMETRVSMIIQSLMFEQNNPRLWRKIHSRVKPFLDRMVALGAMYEYRYDGDQDARNLTSAKVNLPDDIANGKFRCRIFVKPTPPARELQVEWVVTKLSATFTEALADL